MIECGKAKRAKDLIFRSATMDDFAAVKELYGAVVQHMRQNGLFFWNEHYPVEVLREDIQKGRLYLLCEGKTPLCACAIFPVRTPFEGVIWEDNPALYMWRLAVHPAHLRKSLGKTMVKHLKNLTKKQGYPLLRLLVVDCNQPAHAFYQNLGFTKKEGSYQDIVNGKLLIEYGYEYRVQEE